MRFAFSSKRITLVATLGQQDVIEDDADEFVGNTGGDFGVADPEAPDEGDVKNHFGFARNE